MLCENTCCIVHRLNWKEESLAVPGGLENVVCKSIDKWPSPEMVFIKSALMYWGYEELHKRCGKLWLWGGEYIPLTVADVVGMLHLQK